MARLLGVEVTPELIESPWSHLVNEKELITQVPFALDIVLRNIGDEAISGEVSDIECDQGSGLSGYKMSHEAQYSFDKLKPDEETEIKTEMLDPPKNDTFINLHIRVKDDGGEYIPISGGGEEKEAFDVIYVNDREKLEIIRNLRDIKEDLEDVD